MQDRFSTYLKTIAVEKFGEVPEGFFGPLPPEIQSTVKQAEQLRVQVKDLHLDPLKFISEIHYTWLMPVLNRCNEEEKYLFFSLLPEDHQKKMLHEWKIEVDPLDLSPLAKSYFYPKFFAKWSSFPMVPKDKLKGGPLSPLVGYSKINISHIADYLGLFDLSRELYPIVDGQLLRKVFSVFSPPKQKFIKRIMHQRPRILASPFGIKKWDGDPDRLKNFTHFRGLVWLSQALSNEDEDFWWYMTHKLDIGRAHVLVKSRRQRSQEEIDKLAIPVKDLMVKLKF